MDLCGISRIQKATAAGPTQRDGVREVGEGDPIVLLHTQSHLSYLWRQRFAAFASHSVIGRCSPPYRIGMGDARPAA